MEQMIIPIELLEQFERRNVLFFVGDGINQGVLPSLTDLSGELAKRCAYPAESPQTLPQVTRYYELTTGSRHGLIEFLRDRLDLPGLAPSPSHRLILQLQPRVVVTTCYDRLMEQAAQAAKIAYVPVMGNVDVAYDDDQKMLLIWLWGRLDQPNSLVITENDRYWFPTGRENLSAVVNAELARRTWLILGIDVEDDWFRGFYHRATRYLDRYSRRTYIVGARLDSYSRAWWNEYNVQFFDADIEPFLADLSRGLTARAKPAHATASQPVKGLEKKSVGHFSLPMPSPTPLRPYKLLDYYEAGDAAIFFGREGETQKLSALIHAHRLVLLYGASGVGKTSLMLAGIIPSLEAAEPPYEPIYVRTLEDPARVIRRTVRRRLPEASLAEDSPLVDFLAAATEAQGRILVILLDQFEEFFIRLSSQFRAAFIQELGDLVDARDVPVKIVLSLREDWLASMNELRGRIPDVFNIDLRLLPLTRKQARQAITTPVERLGLRYEPALVERLLADLTRSEGGAVIPPQLQLVCNALYDRLEPGEQMITLAMYEALGGARGVLQQYLNHQLSRLPRDEQALTHAILEELVTSQGTKAVKTGDELALALAVDITEVASILEKLVQARLLRMWKLETDERAYELVHEYLIQEIRLRPEVRQRKEIEELLKQEVENWKRFGLPLSKEKLMLIREYEGDLQLSINTEMLIILSAMRAGYEVDYWLDIMSAPAEVFQKMIELNTEKLVEIRQI